MSKREQEETETSKRLPGSPKARQSIVLDPDLTEDQMVDALIAFFDEAAPLPEDEPATD